ncbi:carboxypeptidase S [Rhizopogon vinicolor AM-OR11-026]|uniref:Carboxypeptidase S n=1 Tax=Rhizopogon vinicolor AM-OR11-026 TaxID=1314800 RepID=A0A1B7N4Q7_9AGAM|nr:carboxypeptidase S [Rhizopogon vinicolor AM-OR11-026]
MGPAHADVSLARASRKLRHSSSEFVGSLSPDVNSTTCPQWAALHPTKYQELSEDLDAAYNSEDFKQAAIQALGDAIRVPTESYDDNGPVGEDSRWDTFAELHRVLEATFPRIYGSLNVTKVNTYGLVFHWQGSTTAKPYLLTAHQDVVPVESQTIKDWKHDPYSGYYDGTWIWGRGSCDDKGDLIRQLLAIDSLLKQGFSPARTLILAYGFDEESKGIEGAGRLARYLERTYGRDSFALLLDEGAGYLDMGGVTFAIPSTSEKGYLDVKITVSTLGGHSSVPPSHTSIGLLSRFIAAVEDNPHETSLSRAGTAFATTQCYAAYNPMFPEDLRELARKAVTDDAALEMLRGGLLALDPIYKAMLGTTQAVDLVEGGVKVNALPERASAVVNHRIAEDSSVGELQQHLIDLLTPLALKYDLGLAAFGNSVTSGGAGQVILSDFLEAALEPSPVTPTKYGPWAILQGSIKAAFESSPTLNGSHVVVTPFLSIDTRFYWHLTKHIFRFSPSFETDHYNGEHTINEAVRAASLNEGVRFYTKFILNVDSSDLP